jgi:hypothetical protein
MVVGVAQVEPAHHSDLSAAGVRLDAVHAQQEVGAVGIVAVAVVGQHVVRAVVPVDDTAEALDGLVGEGRGDAVERARADGGTGRLTAGHERRGRKGGETGQRGLPEVRVIPVGHRGRREAHGQHRGGNHDRKSSHGAHGRDTE